MPGHDISGLQTGLAVLDAVGEAVDDVGEGTYDVMTDVVDGTEIQLHALERRVAG